MAYRFLIDELKKLYMKTKTLLSIISIHFVFAVYAQWTSNGPYGGPSHAVTKLSTNYFIGTDNGVFMSSDQGQNWSGAGAALKGKWVSSLEVCDTTLFAGVNYFGVYKSTNNGASWTQINTGINDVSFNFLFCSSGGLYNSTPDGTYFSSNGGNNWTLANNGIPSTYIIYSYAESGSTVYGGTYGMGLYKTTNNGANWVSVGGGFPANSFVYALLSNGTTLYAGTNSGVYKSTDGGVTWVSSNTGFPSGMWANSFAMSGSNIYAGTYSEGILKSTDAGATWTIVNTGIPDLPFNTGLPHNYPPVRGLFAENGTVIAATFDGIYRTVNQAASWTESNNGIRAADLTWITANSSVVLAASEFTGIFSSTDNGNTWTRSNNGLEGYGIITVDASEDAAFAGVQNEKAFVSTDNGVSWANASTGLPSNPKMFQQDTGKVLTITQGAQFVSPGLFETTNNGTNWTQIPTNFQVYPVLNALAFEDNDIYIASDSGRVFYTNNNGTSWTDIGGNLPNGYVFTLFLDGNTLYAGTTGGLYKTTSNGTTWTLMSGIPVDTVNDVIEAAGFIYASSPGNGIYVSNNGGTSWTATNGGLDTLSVVKLASDGTYIYAATRNGVYSMVIPTGIKSEHQNSFVNIFPNPSNGSFTVSSPEGENCLVEVSSLTGQILFKEKTAGGNKNIELKNISKGIYIVTVYGSENTTRHKILIH